MLYGVAMTGIGMLTLTGNNVAMDSFGPISDNANGVAEMAGITEGNTRQTLSDLDAVGNTTKAITKGVAIGSAVIAAVSLFGSFITDVNKINPTALANGIRVSEPLVFIGFLIGGTIPWLFSSIAIKAVERAAGLIVEEVRRQFKDPRIMDYSKEPDYASAVNISTAAAQRELLTLAIISVTSPIIVGLLLGVEALGGFLAGIILSGQLLAELYVQRWRGLGQRQEDHRGRAARARKITRARAASGTRPRWSATRWAIRSRTPPARRSTR